MNVADNEYPADEFDRLADARTIRGTHRRKESNLKWWLALVAVVILAPTAGWAISNYIGSSEEEPAPTASAKEAPSGAPSGASSTAGPSGDPSSSGGNKPSESGKPSGTPSTDASATGKQKLEKAGYTKVSANNYSGGSPAVSTVFYAKASDAQAAKQVAAALGIRPGNVVLAPKATGGDQIVVVLRADAR